MILEGIAQAMEESGKTRCQIGKKTGVDQAVLCRIANDGSFGTKNADKLCLYLGLSLSRREGGRV